MGEAIGAVLAFAVGVGLSPIPAVAAIVMLFTPRASANGPLFLAGWIVGLTVLVTIPTLIADAAGAGTSDSVDDGLSWLRIVLGVALLVAAGRKWHGRPRAGDEPKTPRWMARLDGFGPVQALELGLVLAANPKSLVLAIGAGTGLGQVGATTAQTAVAIAVFVLVGSSLVIVAVGYHLIGGERARATLEEARSWLLAHNVAIMTVLYAVFGAVLISNGLNLRP